MAGHVLMMEKEYKNLKEVVMILKGKIKGLENDNRGLMTDNSRLRKEVEAWQKKSYENFRNSFERK